MANFLVDITTTLDGIDTRFLLAVGAAILISAGIGIYKKARR